MPPRCWPQSRRSARSDAGRPPRACGGARLRTVLTMLSIVLGTSMITGTFILRDQINSAFSSIFQNEQQGHRRGAVASRPPSRRTTARRPGRCRQSVIGRPSRSTASQQGRGPDPGVRLNRRQRRSTWHSSGGAPSLVFSSVTERSPTRSSRPAARRRTGEVAVNQKFANDKHLKVGEQVHAGHRHRRRAGHDRPASSTLSGVSSIGGATRSSAPRSRTRRSGTTASARRPWSTVKAEPGDQPAPS